MNFFHRRKILKRLNFLEATPVRVCMHEESEEGKVSIVVPKFRNPKFNEWFLGRRRSKNFLVKLDNNGSEVWLLIDGKRNVGEICEDLQKKSMEEAVERVTKFLTLLYEQRYITFRELQETDD